MTLPKIAEIRKAIISVVGVVAMLVSLGVLHGEALSIADVVIAVATSAGVYAVPNAAPAAPVVVAPKA